MCSDGPAPDSTARDPAVSNLLRAWRRGDAAALERLMPLIYDELHALARRQLRGERPGHTLQTTALLHEAYLRLVGVDVEWEGRVHFMAVAAATMRRILVDYARSHGRQKRGGGIRPVSLTDARAVSSDPDIDLLALDRALNRLAALDARKARAAELHYFGGLTHEETARALGVSLATVRRELRVAKAWLHRELTQEPGDLESTT